MARVLCSTPRAHWALGGGNEDELRHGVPDARPRAGLLREAASVRAGARAAAELRQLRAGFRHGGEDRAYALYVLARNGRAPIGEVRYYADTRLDRFATPLAKAQLAAALAMLGDRARAEEVFRQALASAEAADRADRRDFGSVLRDRAALVTLASETRTAWNDAQPLVASLTRAHASQIPYIDSGAGAGRCSPPGR